MKLSDLKFRFHQSPIEKLFSRIRSSAKPRVEVAADLSAELEECLREAAELVTFEWDSRHEPLYRARKNNFGQLWPFKPADMGPPESDRASAGRAQLAGVAMLYLADTPLTAISEVKPDRGQYVTVGCFRVKPEKKLRVLDLTRFKAEVYSRSGSELWRLIDLSRHAFSAPAHPEDPRKYAAQAYFVQKVGDIGFDGIGYTSAVHHKGRCFAFFSANNFRCTRTHIHEVKSVSVLTERTKFSLAEKEHVAEMRAKAKK